MYKKFVTVAQLSRLLNHLCCLWRRPFSTDMEMTYLRANAARNSVISSKLYFMGTCKRCLYVLYGLVGPK